MLGSELNELKVISFCPIDYEEVVIYHHHLSSNKGLFIEAPIVEAGNLQKVIVACLDEKFFKSFRHVFDTIFMAENVVFEGKAIKVLGKFMEIFFFKGTELGYPSIFCQSIQKLIPAFKLFKMVSNKAADLIPDLMSVNCIDKNSEDLEMEQIKNNFKEKFVQGSLNIFNSYLENEQNEIENKNELKLELNNLLDNL